MMNQRRHLFFSFSWVLLMLIFFFSLLFVTVVYMAKHNDYFNTLNSYLMISKSLSAKFMFLKISQEHLAELINIFSILFLLSSHIFSYKLCKFAFNKIKSYSLFMITPVLLIEFIRYSPTVYEYLYLGLFRHTDPVLFKKIYNFAFHMTFFMNISILMLNIAFVIIASVKCFKYERFRFVICSITVTFAAVCIIYFLLFSHLPTQLLLISRAANHIRYNSLPIGGYTPSFYVFPLLALCGFITLLISVIHYTRLVRQTHMNEKFYLKSADSNVFTSRVFSHYIKNELLTIIMQLKNCIDQPDSQTIEGIIDYCNGVYKHIDYVKKVNSSQHFEFQKKNLYIPILKSINAFQDAHPDVDIDVKLVHPAPVCIVDSMYIELLCNNLLQNAYEALFTTPNRKITVSSEFEPNMILIHFENNGIPIPRSDISKIFDPFYSTKSTQTNWGIGLYLCKKIMVAHHGTIFVSSNDHRTVFTFSLSLS